MYNQLLIIIEVQMYQIITQILGAMILFLGVKKWCKNVLVLMEMNANQYSFRNTTAAYAMAALPLVTPVPIQDVQLLDYALAHKSVNASYGMTASNTDDIYMGLMNGDPYTSQEQKQRDLYEINDTDWHSVSFEGVHSSSVCHLAMHQDWITNHGYVVDGIVNMNLPEQGISGPFKITSIKHILPQKKPESDLGDVYPVGINGGYEWKPVTGLFIHHSDQVHNITFNSNETIGVTAPHPIFSTTHNDWRLAGELEVGEKVLTYHACLPNGMGEATVTKTEKKGGSEAVYNLEVKDLHNFLVGDIGVVVHNTCDLFDHIFKGKIEITGGVPGAYKFKITGVHHKNALDGVKARIKDGTKTTPNAKGYYKAKVEMHHPDNPNNGGWKTKDEASSFFPDDWDQNKVTDEIAHGLANKQKKQTLVRTRADGTSYTVDRFEGTTSDGTKLQIYIEKGKDVPETVFQDID